MLSFFKKKDPNEFVPTKKMTEAAIIKGIRIGLNREEIVEMVCLMNKKTPQNKIKKIVDKFMS
ncbi:MAG: hypothetical protein HOJ35_05390 [Bdellovibrionales bacterium]|jgi:hypothetical protein|nr:hypothetical protein [Bdellovibrionales bacterium]